jgi:CDP-glucose 4,6-dehydratase
MEILIDSYRKSYFSSGNETSQIISSARAGNVIGGGDWNEDRLIPDVIRSSANHGKLEIRNPMAVRPWQYVLDCLSGYLYLGKLILSGDPRTIGSWNFGPNPKDFLTVSEILGMVNEQLNLDYLIENVSPGPHEAQSLTLDSAKAKKELGWSPILSAKESVFETIEWYKNYEYLNYENSKIFLDRYFCKARTAKAKWVM